MLPVNFASPCGVVTEILSTRNTVWTFLELSRFITAPLRESSDPFIGKEKEYAISLNFSSPEGLKEDSKRHESAEGNENF